MDHDRFIGPLIKTMTIGITALFPSCDMLLYIIVVRFVIAILALVQFMRLYEQVSKTLKLHSKLIIPFTHCILLH
jgi:hypothetical protein